MTGGEQGLPIPLMASNFLEETDHNRVEDHWCVLPDTVHVQSRSSPGWFQDRFNWHVHTGSNLCCTAEPSSLIGWILVSTVWLEYTAFVIQYMNTYLSSLLPCGGLIPMLDE